MRKFSRKIALILALILSLSLPAQAEIKDLFTTPDADAKGMFRYWLPYAIESYEQLEVQMRDMVESGFGGVEISFFPSNASYDNSKYGWATENWRETMKNILKIAASFEEEFVVDFTITPGWPVALNTIDPNDDASDQQLVTAYAKVASNQGIMDLPMLDFSLNDSYGNPFIFTDRLVAAVIAQVTDVSAEGVPTVDPASLKVVETALSDKTTVAGIPCLDGLEESDEAYQYVLGLYGGEAPDTTLFFEDSAGNPISIRTALADTQNYWTVDLDSLNLQDYAPSEGEGLAAGDYVLFGFYERGTGGTILDMGLFGIMEKPLPGVPYYTSPLAEAGTDALIEFLDENLFCDEELIALMKEASATVGGAIFEDSNENFYDIGIPWAEEYAEAFEAQTGYSMLEYLPIITGSAASALGDEAKYHEDYNDTFRTLFSENHVDVLQDYFHEKTGFSYRIQAYYTSTDFVELDLSASSAQADIAEGESLAFGINFDVFRLISGGVHIAGKKFVSDEAFALQEGITYNMPWIRTVNTMNENFAAGVNRLIFHGASYNSLDMTQDEGIVFYSGWPGWHAFDFICTDAWDARMPSWEDIHILSDYIARTQAVLQNGTAKMDLLVLDLESYDHETRERVGDNSAFTQLLDAGYSYDCVMDDGLLLPQNVVEDGRLCADGPAYKALVVNALTATSVEVMNQLITFAGAGLPVILYNGVPAAADSNLASDAEIAALAEQLTGMENVALAATQAEILEALAGMGVTPYAAYAQENLRNLLREDEDGSRYYFLYNNSDETISVPVQFDGVGSAYLLNAWTGDITPAAICSADDSGVTTTLYMDGHDAIIVAVTPSDSFPAAVANPIISTSGEAVLVDGEAAVRVGESGSVTAEYADGTTLEAEVEVPESIALDNWNLSIESWGPNPASDSVTEILKTPIEVGETALAVWDDLAVTQEQLDAAGVTSMQEVVGIGRYTLEIDLEAMDGAYLVLQHGDDMITGITVNGQAVEDLAVNANRFDLGGLLVEGTNTIEVKLATTLINRIRVEDPLFESSEPGIYGLTSAELQPYAVVQ